MSLNVDTTRVTDKAVKFDPYGAGMTMLVIGICQANKKNAPEIQARIDFVNALDSMIWNKPSIKYTAKQLIGIHANVNTETRAKWSKRITENFFRERTERAQRILAEAT